MSRAVASPFDQLLGIKPGLAPRSTSTTVVVQGEKVTDVRQIDKLEDEPEVAEQLRREARAARAAASYQRDRQDPEKMAKRQAWLDANREKRRAYMEAWRIRNRDRLRELKRDWAKRNYHADREAAAERTRAYYAANREAILAKLKAQRDAAKAAKAANATQEAGKP